MFWEQSEEREKRNGLLNASVIERGMMLMFRRNVRNESEQELYKTRQASPPTIASYLALNVSLNVLSY